ncbi:hypothetical protein BDV32DRAFT_114884 [Aspergillus pseudonomiae]|nr:hypothetical protein BDV32DRAFT_114884 [Aspergillus pseudonomiae]
MSFWDDFLQGVEQGAGFVINNAGNILDTVGAFLPFLLEENQSPDIIEDQNALLTAVRGLRGANKKMEVKADELEKHLDPRPSGWTQDGPFDLDGIWPQPSLNDSGIISPDIAGDINKYICTLDLPTVIGGADVGQSLGNQMFSPAGLGDLDSDPINYSDIGKVKSDDLIIQGYQVYLPIPMNSSSNNVWNSKCRLYVQQSPDFPALWAEKKKSRAPKAARDIDDSKPYNTATVSAKWTGSTDEVHDIMKQAINTVQETGADKITLIKPSTETGNIFTYNFRTDVTVGPAAVKRAFANAIHESIPKTGDIPQMPRVTLDHSATIVPPQQSSTGR